ncbi:MAG: bifunctional lysylphosphatidylglycerol synthetase/lysine--tRNA ligase LysX [Bifidobacteriaceae bacterium]|jgi:lysyl-tRNA synthetase class 2|nr:bifunctional lysylphosphatidylglycerol synthetase/lysine--tRNA ligase LysX [Bifidobacteriaceae bacterium]
MAVKRQEDWDMKSEQEARAGAGGGRGAGGAAPGSSRTALWAGRLFAFAGLWALLAYPVHRLAPQVYRVAWAVLDALNLPASPSLFNCAALLVIASAIRHRKRVALWAVIILLEAPAVVYGAWLSGVWLSGLKWREWLYPGLLVHSSDDSAPVRVAVAALVGIAISWWLWAHRREFAAPVAKGVAWRAVLALVAGLAIAWAWAFSWAVAVGEKAVGWGLKVWWAANTALGQGWEEIVLGAGVAGRPAATGSAAAAAVAVAPHWVGRTTTLIATLGLLAALVVFTRSDRHLPGATADQELALRALLLRHGEADSLGYFNTRRDKAVVFSSDGRAAVAGRLVGGTLLASADPVGERAAWGDAIGQWMALARRHGWTPAVASATPRGGRAWEAAGLRALELGDEAVIRVDDFSLRDHRLREVADAARRVRKAGYTARVRRLQDVPPDELAALAGLADQWRRGGEERGFSMTSGRVGDPADGQDVVVTAHDAAGEVRALLTFAPWGRRGISLDVMRHSPQAHGGTTEFMVASLVEAARDMGIERISLNFAVLRRFLTEGAAVGAYPVARLLRRVMMLASKWWQLDGLYRSNQKYAPDWQPRVVCFDRGASLTEVIAAVARAEGFLPERSAADVLSGTGGRDEAARQAAFAEAVRAQEAAALAVAAPAQRPGARQAARLVHRDALAAAGLAPNPVAVPRTGSIRQALRLAAEHSPDLAGAGEISLVGRILRKRDHGGVVFAELRERVSEIQVMARREALERFDLFKHHAQLGDLVSVTGRLALTRSGALALDAASWAMAAKSIAPTPPKRRLADQPARLTPAMARAPHILLATNNRAMDMVYARAAATAALRAALQERRFIEVETPVLQPIHGGANARPFRTHINAYDMDLYLRIAPELYLKRLAVGGVERVFELGKNFRNEGVDRKHNPEFTSLEAYQAFSDYDGMRLLTQDLIRAAALAVHGEAVAVSPDGRKVGLAGDWPVVSVHQAVSRAAGVELTASSSLEAVRAAADAAGVGWLEEWTAGEVVSEMYDALVEGQTFEPTFYKDFPVETSPLTRAHRSIPGLAERWDLVAFGAEVGTAYSELTDPVDERARLTAQSVKAAAGDPEAMEIDEDFLGALDFGLVPMGGLGLGVDRVVMTLTGATIRETLTFPFARPA